MIDYSKLELSLKHLDLQFLNYQSSGSRPGLSELDKEGIAESVIQRFETCYDALWKILKRYLIEELGIPDVPNSPKAIFRLGFENRLFPSVEQWLVYADARTQTAHDYDGNKAKACLLLMPAFIHDAIHLYQAITGKLWK